MCSSDLKRLDMDELMPYRRTDTDQRLGLFRYKSAIDSKESQSWALRTLGEKAKSRHNWLHPDQPVSAVALRYEEWPLQKTGFLDGRGNPGNVVRFQVITTNQFQ